MTVSTALSMTQGFWTTLPKPFVVLAPLADITDAAFRRIIATYGKPHVFWTEFTSADRLCTSESAGVVRNLLYTEAERPIVAQLYGACPGTMEQAAALVASRGFDGIDLNMGCPERSVVKRGAGAALSTNHTLAKAMIRAAKRGAGDLPVSVKIRLGDSQNDIESWLPVVLEEAPAVVTIHARTRCEKSKVPAHWEVMTRAVDIRRALASPTYIIGNGDVIDVTEAWVKAATTGVDGVMLGRAIMGNPWLFNVRKSLATITTEEKLRVMVEHTLLFEELLGDVKDLALMKKHYRAYTTDFPGAEALRLQLMHTQSAAEVAHEVATFLSPSPRRSALDHTRTQPAIPDYA